METTQTNQEQNQTTKQSRETAMAETLAMLNDAEGWITLCTATDENGELTGAAKVYVDTDQLTDLMVAVGLNEPTFCRALLKAALHISRLINKRGQETPNN